MATQTSSRPQSKLDPACESLLSKTLDTATASLVDSLRDDHVIHRAQPREQIAQTVRAVLELLLRAMTDPDSLETAVPEACRARASWTTLSAPATISYVGAFRDYVVDLLLTAVADGVSGSAEAIRIANRAAERMLVLVAEHQSAQASMFKALATYSVDGIVVTNMENRIIYVNDALVQMNGMKSAEEYCAQDFASLMTKSQIDILMNEAFPAVEQHGAWKGYFWAKRPDGSEWRAFNAISRLYDDDGTPILTCSIIRDVTKEHEADLERARLQEEVIAAQRETLRELSAPLIPLADGVTVMPLIGSVDAARATEILKTLLDGVHRYEANTVIIDVTGLKVVDTQVGTMIVNAARATRLLGAEVILTGISPEIAQTFVGFGAELEGIITRSTLQRGIQQALRIEQETSAASLM